MHRDMAESGRACMDKGVKQSDGSSEIILEVELSKESILMKNSKGLVTFGQSKSIMIKKFRSC